MNDPIFEAVVTTVDAAGQPHVAPMGVRWRPLADGRPGVVLMPFKPSTTHDNIVATGNAVLNLLTDSRVFAGCVTGRRQWPLASARRINGQRLACALRHLELQLAERLDDAQRPVLGMSVLHDATHAPFDGLNRAQAAVLEGSVLVSRLHLLPLDKIRREMAYLQIAIDKTAGAAEREAWHWLCEAVDRHATSQADPPAQETSA